MQVGDLGSMDMAADQPVDPAANHLIGDCRLEVTDIMHGVLDLMFHETGKRPIVETELTPYQAHPTIGLQQPIVGFGAHEQEGPRGPHDGIELIAMHDEQTPAIGCDVHDLIPDKQIAKFHAIIITEQLIVVARHINYLGATFGLA